MNSNPRLVTVGGTITSQIQGPRRLPKLYLSEILSYTFSSPKGLMRSLYLCILASALSAFLKNKMSESARYIYDIQFVSRHRMRYKSRTRDPSRRRHFNRAVNQIDNLNRTLAVRALYRTSHCSIFAGILRLAYYRWPCHRRKTHIYIFASRFAYTKKARCNNNYTRKMFSDPRGFLAISPRDSNLILNFSLLFCQCIIFFIFPLMYG